jgi:hypothetical protein
MRAYVTSGAASGRRARSAMRTRYDLVPCRVASSRLAHTSGANASRSTHRLLAAISG